MLTTASPGGASRYPIRAAPRPNAATPAVAPRTVATRPRPSRDKFGSTSPRRSCNAVVSLDAGASTYLEIRRYCTSNNLGSRYGRLEILW